MRSVFFAIPSHSGEIKVGMFTSIIQSMADLTARGAKVVVQCWVGDSLLPHARNVLVAKFVESDCDDMVFLDSDLAWGSDAMMRLLDHPVDFVAGGYRFKNDTENYPFHPLPGTTEFWSVDMRTGEPSDDGVIEVAAVPTGFLRLTRKAIEQLIEANKDKTYRHTSAPELPCHLLFDLEYRDGQYYGEDYVFCRKWRDLGGKIYLDPEIKINHIGNKDFPGDFGNWLRTRGKEAPTDPLEKIKEVFAKSNYPELFRRALGECA